MRVVFHFYITDVERKTQFGLCTRFSRVDVKKNKTNAQNSKPGEYNLNFTASEFGDIKDGKTSPELAFYVITATF